MTQKSILCIGLAILDQIYSVTELPRAGKNFAKGFLEVGGGPAATASVAVARLGLPVTLWTRLGDDALGQRIATELESYGVSLKDVQRAQGAVSPLATVFVNEAGERQIVSFVDPNLPQDCPDWLPLDRVRDFGCVLADMRWPAAAAKVLDQSARHGVPSVVDADLAPSVDALNILVPLARHAVFSEGGLRMFSGEENPEAGLKAAAGRIQGVPYVTLGEQGCMWWDREKAVLERLPAFQVRVKDTTGAGDVFHGAFAVALAEGKRGREAVRFASATAALKCTRMGGRSGIPDRATLEAFLAEHGAI